jgi:hypothetical protein
MWFGSSAGGHARGGQASPFLLPFCSAPAIRVIRENLWLLFLLLGRRGGVGHVSGNSRAARPARCRSCRFCFPAGLRLWSGCFRGVGLHRRSAARSRGCPAHKRGRAKPAPNRQRPARRPRAAQLRACLPTRPAVASQQRADDEEKDARLRRRAMKN